MFTMFQSHMNMYALTGQKCDLHELGHNGDPASKGTLAVSKVIAWHMKHFALPDRQAARHARRRRQPARQRRAGVPARGRPRPRHRDRQDEQHPLDREHGRADRRARRRPQARPARRRRPGKHPANVLITGDERGRASPGTWARSPATSRPCSARPPGRFYPSSSSNSSSSPRPRRRIEYEDGDEDEDEDEDG